MKVTEIIIVISALGEGAERLWNWTMLCDHPKYSIVEISQNIDKSLTDLRRFAVTQISKKDHQLTQICQTCGHVTMAWIDFRKTCDMVQQKGIIESLKIKNCPKNYRIHHECQGKLENEIDSGRTNPNSCEKVSSKETLSRFYNSL